jgi:hypothetical protein
LNLSALDQVVPFGQSLDEYRLMFSLSEEDVAKAIIGIADGPASFNAGMHALGKRVVSVEPLYVFSGRTLSNGSTRSLTEGRYATDALPQLDFTRDQFDLALCHTFSSYIPITFPMRSTVRRSRRCFESRQKYGSSR